MANSLFALLAFVSVAANAENLRYVFKGFSSVIATSDVKRMTFGLSAEQVEKIAALTQGRVNFGDVYYVDKSRDSLNAMSALDGFSSAIYPNVPPPVEQDQTVKPGDPELRNEWWIEKLKVPEAWKMATGQGVVIADCDAGYYHEESDLKANMLLEHRYDLSDRDEPLVIDDGGFATHGTSVAAIMLGVMDMLGTNGIAYNSKLVPLQNFNYDHSDDLDKEEATAACVLRAIATPDVDIIVLENQTENGSSETFVGTRDAVRLAHEAGIIVVSAAGNNYSELLEEKKDNTGSIIVGALLQSGSQALWSNFGARVSVAAYGEALHTLSGPNGRFEDFGGTSGATPQVAATVALMKEVLPTLNPTQAREILVATRTTTPGNAKVGGRLNVPEAVKMALETPPDWQAWSRQWMFRQELKAILLSK